MLPAPLLATMSVNDFILFENIRIMSKITITELQGDGIGPEVAESLHAVAESLPVEFEFRQIDWSLETRERLGEEAIDAAEESMRETKLAVSIRLLLKPAAPMLLFADAAISVLSTGRRSPSRVYIRISKRM